MYHYCLGDINKAHGIWVLTCRSTLNSSIKACTLIMYALFSIEYQDLYRINDIFC